MLHGMTIGFDNRSAESAILFCWYGAEPPLTLSLPEQIALRLGGRIISGALPPAEHIIEQDVAAEFGVSRAPVREALRILEREGLAVIHPRRGCAVAQLTKQEVSDIFEIRVALYRVVARHFAETRSPTALRLMERSLQQLEQFADREQAGDDYASIVFRLGLEMAEAAGNASLSRMIASLALRTFRYSRLGLKSTQRRKDSLVLWRGEYRAIKSGDIEKACNYAAQRVERSCREALRVIEHDEIPVQRQTSTAKSIAQ
jgi:DNA-binding GntR family transcriptional regulator